MNYHNLFVRRSVGCQKVTVGYFFYRSAMCAGLPLDYKSNGDWPLFEKFEDLPSMSFTRFWFGCGGCSWFFLEDFKLIGEGHSLALSI